MFAIAIWDGVREALGSVLAFFYSVVPNSGVAIIMLTVTVRLALFPLTAKQAKSMIAMQRVQPEIKKLQAKYKNDKQKLNEEMMKFYKENEINPLGGCLPLLLQMPIFIALYQTLNEIEKFIPHGSKMFADICGASAQASSCKAKALPFIADMNLRKSASDIVNGKATGIGDAVPYLVLVALVLITGYLQQRQTMRNQTTPNPQMAIISKVFPIVFGFISWGIPSGVVLYFFTSNLWQIGQQEVVLRTIGTAAGPPPKRGRRADPDASPSGTAVVVDDAVPKGTRKQSAGSDAAATKKSDNSARSKKGATNGPRDGNGSNGQGQTPNQQRSNRKRKR
ncbi:MAG: YidC/Oxa1 family membrane protein insertase [Acidimicrobiia bacterium]